MNPSRAPLGCMLLTAACVEPPADEPAGPSEPHIERLAAIPAGAHGLAMDDDGKLFVADTFRNAGSVSQVYRTAPPYSRPEPSGISGPGLAGLLWHDGYLHATDIQHGGILVVEGGDAESGNLLDCQPSWNIFASQDGTLHVVNVEGQVQRALPDGSVPLLAGLQAPFDAVFDPDQPEAMWISEQFTANPDGRVGLWSPDGTLLRELDHAWSNPEGLGIDTEGNLWVAETGEGVLLRFDRLSGELISRHDVPGMPVVISEDPRNGDLLVSVTGEEPGVWVVSVGQASMSL